MSVDVSRLDHERFCALWFSRSENRVRTADIQRMAAVAATRELPYAWFVATRDTTDEAKYAYDRHVAAIAAMRQ